MSDPGDRPLPPAIRILAYLAGSALTGAVFFLVVAGTARAIRLDEPPAPPISLVPLPEPPPEELPPPDPPEVSRLTAAVPAPEPGPPSTVAVPITDLPATVELRVPEQRLAFDGFASLETGATTREQIERFTFADLDTPPRSIFVPRPRIPQSLAEAGFSRGIVTFRIHIDKRGEVTVLEVLDTTEAALVPAAREAAERARFEIPTVGGTPVETTGSWPLSIQLQ